MNNRNSKLSKIESDSKPAITEKFKCTTDALKEWAREITESYRVAKSCDDMIIAAEEAYGVVSQAAGNKDVSDEDFMRFYEACHHERKVDEPVKWDWPVDDAKKFREDFLN